MLTEGKRSPLHWQQDKSKRDCSVQSSERSAEEFLLLDRQNKSTRPQTHISTRFYCSLSALMFGGLYLVFHHSIKSLNLFISQFSSHTVLCCTVLYSIVLYCNCFYCISVQSSAATAAAACSPPQTEYWSLQTLNINNYKTLILKL